MDCAECCWIRCRKWWGGSFINWGRQDCNDCFLTARNPVPAGESSPSYKRDNVTHLTLFQRYPPPQGSAPLLP